MKMLRECFYEFLSFRQEIVYQFLKISARYIFLMIFCMASMHYCSQALNLIIELISNSTVGSVVQDILSLMPVYIQIFSYWMETYDDPIKCLRMFLVRLVGLLLLFFLPSILMLALRDSLMQLVCEWECLINIIKILYIQSFLSSSAIFYSSLLICCLILSNADMSSESSSDSGYFLGLGLDFYLLIGLVVC